MRSGAFLQRQFKLGEFSIQLDHRTVRDEPSTEDRILVTDGMEIEALIAEREKCTRAIERIAADTERIKLQLVQADIDRGAGGALKNPLWYLSASRARSHKKALMRDLQLVLGEINRRIRAAKRRIGREREELFVAVARSRLPRETYEEIWLEVWRLHPEAR